MKNDGQCYSRTDLNLQQHLQQTKITDDATEKLHKTVSLSASLSVSISQKEVLDICDL